MRHELLLTNTLPLPWRQPRLLLPDCDQRVYVGRAPRRDKRREQRHRQQQNWRNDKRHRVSWRDVEKLTGNQACGAKRRREAETNPEQSQDQSLPQHHAQDGSRSCAERYANANLARALADGVGQDAVQTDAGERQRQQPEETGKSADQPLLHQRLVNLPGERLDIVEREARVNFTRRLPDGGDDAGRISGSTELESRIPLPKAGRIKGALRRFAQAAVLGILDNADDFRFVARLVVTEALPNRVCFAKVVARESLVYDHGLLTAFPVKISRRKAASAHNRHADSFKILWPDADNMRTIGRARGRRPSLDMQRAQIFYPVFTEQPRPPQARGAHARNRFEAFE